MSLALLCNGKIWYCVWNYCLEVLSGYPTPRFVNKTGCCCKVLIDPSAKCCLAKLRLTTHIASAINYFDTGENNRKKEKCPSNKFDNNLVMSSSITMTSHERQITSHSTVRLTAYADLHQSPRHWTFFRGIHRWPVNSPHKGPVMRKKLPFDDAIVEW